MKKEAVARATASFFILHIFQSSDCLFRTDPFVSECFYDDEHHGDKEDPEDGRNGRTEDDGDAHGYSVYLLVMLYGRQLGVVVGVFP